LEKSYSSDQSIGAHACGAHANTTNRLGDIFQNLVCNIWYSLLYDECYEKCVCILPPWRLLSSLWQFLPYFHQFCGNKSPPEISKMLIGLIKFFFW